MKPLTFLRQRPHNDTLMLIITAIIIGVVVGFATVAFDLMVHAIQEFSEGLRERSSLSGHILISLSLPILGAILITPVVVRWAPDVRGSGIPAVMLSVSNLGGYISKRIAFWRPIVTTIAIGSGASLGVEGPVVHMGGSLASSLSELFKFNDKRRRGLVAVAAASGISASFNAPIAGVLFALEEILGEFGHRSFAAVVIGAVTASAIAHNFLGDSYAFFVPEYRLGSPLELPFYFILGNLCAFVAVLFIRVMVFTENSFNALKLNPWLRPLFGALLLGAMSIWLPDILGRGYHVTGEALLGLDGHLQLGFGFFILICVMKILATNICLAAWNPGGIFAPLLMIGATFGAAFGLAAGVLFPQLELNYGHFALVGMASVLAGAIRSPMTSIVMIFEMSGSYSMILPLLLGAGVATLIADLIHPESIYHLILSRKGLSLLRLREADLLQNVLVAEVMDKEIPSLRASDSLKALSSTLAESHHHGFVVMQDDDPRRILGMVTLSDLEKARQEGIDPESKIERIAKKQVHTALAEEAISSVLERMAQLDIGRMPVVSPKEPDRAIGYVRQSDLAKAYYRAVQRQRQHQYDKESLRLRDLTGQEIIEVKVRPQSQLAGLNLREAKLPKECLIISIRKGGKMIFPHGDTRLEIGDIVVANVAPGFSRQFKAYF
ncbi:MAG: chloride channel protein [Deinococcales bacterium]